MNETEPVMTFEEQVPEGFTVRTFKADEKLRGGLVEAGMALAMQKTVIVIGKDDDYGTWQYHPNVYRCETFDDARILLRALTVTPIED